MLGYVIYYLRDVENDNGSRGGINPIDGTSTDPPAAQPPSLEPSPMPSNTPTIECTSTVGPCVRTFAEFFNVLDLAGDNDVVALCSDLIIRSEPIVRPANLTLCCATVPKCTLIAAGGHRNLLVVGRNFRVHGIHFLNGTSNNIDAGNGCGANVAIVADGDHDIVDCIFQGAKCASFGYGGSLYVNSPTGSLTIRNSIFTNNQASFGGAVAVEAPVFKASDCIFEENSGSAVVSLLRLNRDPSQDITFERSSFINNEGDYGGGFLASGIGDMPKLSVLSCLFHGNVATSGGGAGAAFPGLNVLDLKLFNNSGDSNLGVADECDGFLVSLGEYTCFEVIEDFPVRALAEWQPLGP